MATNTKMNDAINAVLDKATSQASTSSPEDLVYLGKALEAVGSSSALNFLTQVGEDQATAIETNGNSAVSNVQAEKSSAITTIQAQTSQFGKFSHLMNNKFNGGSGGSYRSSFVINTEGVAMGWGCDNANHQANGQGLGNHSGVHPLSFYSTDGTTEPSKFIQIESSGYNGMALDDNGHVWTWGYNGHGQIGVGHTSCYEHGHFVSALNGVNIVQIAQGKGFSNSQAVTNLALSDTGDVYSWGYNSHGQCGRNGTTTNSTVYTPAKITSTIDSPTIVKIYACNGADAGHMGCIDNNGKAYIWGYNGYGNCGSGNTGHQTTPLMVNGRGAVPLSANIKHMVLKGHSYNFSHVIASDGKMYGCGYNGHGQLNNGNTSQQNNWVANNWFNGSNDDRRVKISNGSDGFYGEDIGSYTWVCQNNSQSSTHALSKSNKLYGWGNNDSGNLGNGNGTDTNSGQPYHCFTGDVWYIAKGGFDGHSFSLLLTKDGNLYTTGYDGNYVTLTHSGRGDPRSFVKPDLPAGVQGNIKNLCCSGTTSESVGNVILENGTLYCWGYGGEMAQGTDRDSTIGSMHHPTFS